MYLIRAREDLHIRCFFRFLDPDAREGTREGLPRDLISVRGRNSPISSGSLLFHRVNNRLARLPETATGASRTFLAKKEKRKGNWSNASALLNSDIRSVDNSTDCAECIDQPNYHHAPPHVAFFIPRIRG
jgi:hypothetical protein